MADWIYSVQSIIFKECSNKHMPHIITKLAVAAPLQTIINNALWLKNNPSKPLYQTTLDLTKYQLST